MPLDSGHISTNLLVLNFFYNLFKPLIAETRNTSTGPSANKDVTGLFQRSQWRKVPTIESWTVKEELYSLRSVIATAVGKYFSRQDLGMETLKRRIEHYMETQWNSQLSNYGFGSYPGDETLAVHLTSDVQIIGLVHAINLAWNGNVCEARLACVAPVPYLNTRGETSFGLKCERCLRDSQYADYPAQKRFTFEYLPEQLSAHIQSCESAKVIMHRERLRLDADDKST